MLQKSNITNHHAHLWVGDHLTLIQELIKELQKLLCLQQGCQVCSTCMHIAQKQHPWIHWLEPEGSYTLEQIDEVLAQVRFKLHNQEHRFFIFTQADELTANCNNRLLKTIEEPHAGYVFIFLTNRTDNLLSTLMSRCFIKEFDQRTYQHDYQEIIEPFLTGSFTHPVEFIKLIDKYEIKERETKDVIDLLIQLFHEQLHRIHRQNKPDQAEHMLAITDNIILLKQALLQLPVQGSAKLFWKNMYLKFHNQNS